LICASRRAILQIKQHFESLTLPPLTLIFNPTGGIAPGARGGARDARCALALAFLGENSGVPLIKFE